MAAAARGHGGAWRLLQVFLAAHASHTGVSTLRWMVLVCAHKQQGGAVAVTGACKTRRTHKTVTFSRVAAKLSPIPRTHSPPPPHTHPHADTRRHTASRGGTALRNALSVTASASTAGGAAAACPGALWRCQGGAVRQMAALWCVPLLPRRERRMGPGTPAQAAHRQAATAVPSGRR